MGDLKYRYSEELNYLKENVLPMIDELGKKYIKSIINHFENEEMLFESLNLPRKPITRNWEASKCPSCLCSFFDYEPCDDGYYKRAKYLERCPYCGQKLHWH